MKKNAETSRAPTPQLDSKADPVIELAGNDLNQPLNESFDAEFAKALKELEQAVPNDLPDPAAVAIFSGKDEDVPLPFADIANALENLPGNEHLQENNADTPSGKKNKAEDKSEDIAGAAKKNNVSDE